MTAPAAARELVRLHANEHPEAALPGLFDALRDAGRQLHRYPSGADALAEAIAEYHGVPPENVLVGAGSAEIIGLLWRVGTDAGRAAAFAAPGFELYPLLCRQCDAPIVNWPAFAPLPADLPPGVGVVAVSNPHNPTGRLIPRRELAVLAANAAAGAIVLNDEAYAEYADWDADDRSVLSLSHLPNVLTTRTFSKLYGLAALRVGYAIGAPELIARLAGARMPFTVGELSSVAALHALARRDELAAARSRIRADRTWLASELRARGFEVSPSEANFVWAVPPAGADWAAALVKRGVLVKAVPPALRISVGSRRELRRLLEAVDDVLA
jgi:histidinol-phosphate aminotransferase